MRFLLVAILCLVFFTALAGQIIPALPTSQLCCGAKVDSLNITLPLQTTLIDTTNTTTTLGSVLAQNRYTVLVTLSPYQCLSCASTVSALAQAYKNCTFIIADLMETATMRVIKDIPVPNRPYYYDPDGVFIKNLRGARAELLDSWLLIVDNTGKLHYVVGASINYDTDLEQRKAMLKAIIAYK